ncbi:hypothetical protein F383_25831 [Gossypium arboreum]|uniref:Uncharacterized protein n=1 Tax=Gossypium arboreum TaxID=29729 RepID=A0A0B0MDP9_GOSAR|nr:hypothetical protein F383_37775 [Gossypium arboreum]KHG18475.1 hypothetical protein F383_25831 [Gossypium arboreum]
MIIIHSITSYIEFIISPI